MLDLNTEAFVLDKEDIGEYDNRIFLYTKDLGKVVARSTSSRKITSKLAAHLQPLSHVKVRLVSKRDYFSGNGLQLVDALPADSGAHLTNHHSDDSRRQRIEAFNFLKLALPAGIPDLDVWELLMANNSGSRTSGIGELLEFLGFDPSFAACELCKRSGPEYFFAPDSFFICKHCALNSNVHFGELALINK